MGKSLTTFSRNEIKDWIGQLEDGLAEFVGYEYSAARLVANIVSQVEAGQLCEEKGSQLLADSYRMARLAQFGHRWGRWCRNPPAEVEVLVLTAHKRLGETER